MPSRNASIPGATTVALTAGLKFQPLFLDFDGSGPAANLPENRAPSPAFDLAIQPQANHPSLSNNTKSWGAVKREGMNAIAIMVAGHAGTDIFGMRVTRWYRVVLPLTDTQETSDVWIPVAQTYDLTLGDNNNATLPATVASLDATHDFVDTITRQVGVGSPDENIYSPANDFPAILFLDVHGADVVSIEIDNGVGGDPPDDVQVFVAFE